MLRSFGTKLENEKTMKIDIMMMCARVCICFITSHHSSSHNYSLVSLSYSFFSCVVISTQQQTNRNKNKPMRMNHFLSVRTMMLYLNLLSSLLTITIYKMIMFIKQIWIRREQKRKWGLYCTYIYIITVRENQIIESHSHKMLT